MTKKSPTPYSLLPTPSPDPGLLAAALLALFAVVPLLVHAGLPNTADGPAHLMRQAELNQAWRDGIFYPRWAPDLAYGYGMPLFHYAPPLLYQVTQLFHLTGLALDAAMKASIVLMMFAYSLGMYLFARDVYGPRAGLLAAAVYLYAPYRLREAYVQGNYGQFFGLAFYPLILWSFHGLVTTSRRRYLPLAAVSLAGLLLSHNISAMIFAPLFGAYLVFLLVLRGRLEGWKVGGLEGWKTGRLEGWRAGSAGDRGTGDETSHQSTSLPFSQPAKFPIFRVLFAVALGLGLSAFFWLPAFGERDLIRLPGITTGFFDFRTNFISLAELLAPPRPLDLSAVNPYFPLSLGAAQIVYSVLAFVVIGCYFVVRSAYFVLRRAYCVVRTPLSEEGTPLARAHAMWHTLFFGGALLVTTFLALPYSRPVWEAVPLLELAEFPWRWLGPALLCAAALAGGVFYTVEALINSRWPLAADRWSLVALAVGLAFAIAVSLVYLFPSQFIPWGTPAPADAMAYEVESGAIGTTSAGEFLPRWADRFPEPESLGPDYAAGRLPAVIDPASLPDGASATTLAHTARETRLAVSSPVPFAATLRALYWPDWRVFVAAETTGETHRVGDVQITRPDGLIRAPLPAGEYQVSLRLFPTPIRRAATIISALAAVVLLGLVLVWLGGWKVGWLEGWKVGRLEGWMVGRLEDWKTGRLEDREAGDEASPSSTSLPIHQSTNLPAFQSIIIGAALIVGLLVTRPMAGWFRVQSPPGVAYGAQYEVRADFGDQVRLEGWKIGRLDGWELGDKGSPPSTSFPIFQSSNLPIFQPSTLPTIQAKAGKTLPVVLYWRALTSLSDNHSVFVHLDALDGTTYASADELNPADIPTSRWPPSLYVRNPLTLELPADLPPMRYTLTAGLYDPESGARLPVAGPEGTPEGTDAWPLASVWITSSAPLDARDIPNRLEVRLGDHISLLGYELAGPDPVPDPMELTLYWRAEAPVEDGYTVFIHALDAEGATLAQFDAPPLGGLHPTHAWMPGQIVADTHVLALPDSAGTLSIGLYDPLTLARLPAYDGRGERLPDDAIRVEVNR